jgi:hypothetical protein
MIKLVDTVSTPVPYPPGANQELIETTDRQNARRLELKKITNDLFGEAPCVSALGLVIRDGRLVEE